MGYEENVDPGSSRCATQARGTDVQLSPRMLWAFRGSSYDCPSTDRYVSAVLPSPREIDMMAIGSSSKALAGPPVRKVTTENKEGA